MKYLKIPKQLIKSLTDDRRGCIASDRITVGGERVGYMYRDQPADPADSGWRFLAGTESEADMRDNSRHGVYAINTIANYDPDILPLIDSDFGSAFERVAGSNGFSLVES